MALTFITGNTFSNGDSATSLKLNNMVNLASYSGSLEIAHGGTGATAITGSGGVWNNLGVNNGTNLHTSTSGLTIGDSATCQLAVGQDSTHALIVQWTYNTTPGNASSLITTYGQNNPIKIQSSSLSYDSASQANCLQIVSAGRAIFSAAQADDGIHQLQVVGGLSYDRAQTGITSISYAATVTIDFNAGFENKTVSLAGGITLASANLGPARKMTVYLNNSSGSTQSIAFAAGWAFLGSAAPTSIPANKVGVLTLFSQNTFDSGVLATYSQQV